jgi:hypothetical protein
MLSSGPLPGAVLLQRWPDGGTAGGGQCPGLLQHGPQRPLAGPEKVCVPAHVPFVTCAAASCPQQGERYMSGS